MLKKISIAFLAGIFLAGLGTGASLAQTSTPYLNLSNVTATGSNIFITRLPIRLPTGSYILKDVTIHIDADANGVLKINPATPVQATSPGLISNTFRTGNYLWTSNTDYGFKLTGPIAVPGRSVSKWIADVLPGKARYYGVPLVFYVGSLSSHPNYTRLSAAGITGSEYSYGIVGADYYYAVAGEAYWGTGAIVGYSQSGNLITIASFTRYNPRRDENLPIAYFTFRAQ
jgi:hypothetical protein